MAERIKGVVKQRSMLNTTEDRLVEFVDKHETQAKPVSINFLRRYVKKMNQQMEAKDPKTGSLVLSDFDRKLLEKKRDAHYEAIKMFQASYAVGDYMATAARQFCRRNEVHLQDDDAVTVSRPLSPTTLQRTSSSPTSEDSFGYTPRPGSVLKRGHAIEQEYQREAMANRDLEAVVAARRSKTEKA